MRFSKALNELIRLAEIKKIDLADILNYDNSYISKWCNDHHLPNPNYDPMLLERMAGFFARLIYANRNQEELIEFTKRKLPLETPEMLEIFIHSLLTASLQNSITQDEKIEVFPKQNKVFTGHESIVRETASSLQLLSSLPAIEELNIYSNVNLSKSLLGHPAVRALFYSTRTISVNYHQFLTEERCPTDEEIFTDLMKWLTRSLSMNVSVYTTKEDLPERFIYVEDHCILLFETNDYGLPMVMSLITDEKF